MKLSTLKHLHHCHITGNIIGYAHDFCNAKVRENKDMLTCIAHNFFHFDMFFYQNELGYQNWTNKIIVSGKGVISYEKIDSINVLQKRPENRIFFSEE